MRTYGGLTVLAFALFLTPSLCEASSKFVWQPYDPDSGVIFNSYRIEVEDGGTYVVPEDALGTGKGVIDDPDWISPYTRANLELFYLPDPSNLDTRELIGDARDFSWPRPGTYEIDTYAFAVAPSSTPADKFMAWLVPRAHAAPAGEYIDTIRFTISIGPPLGDPCCSSVLFIPGMQGSGLAVGDDEVWPPTVWSDDVEQLAVTAQGESVNTVTVTGALRDFYDVPIYSGFLDYLDSLTADSGSGVAGWKALAYDWRLPFSKTINEGIETTDGTEDVISTIENLASESNTGKVTIVAHSMGGLLGKAIIKELADRGQENLIDGFIMVGVPQLGTPQGAAGILHGNDQGIPGGSFLPGIVVDPAEAREVAQNMATAYSLMPSARYFNEVTTPVITFDTSSAFTEAWRSHWGNTLNTYPKFKEFLIGSGVPRTNPDDELNIPEILNPSVMQDIEDFHAQFDQFDFPENIHVVQIAGWGLPTVKTIDYRTEHGEQNFEVLFTKEGDGTVVYSSAVATNELKYFVDLFAHNRDLDQANQHRDILSILAVQEVISQELGVQDKSNIEYISQTKPPVSNTDDQLFVSTHSPVVLGAYDNQGRYTGATATEDSGFIKVDQEIPGSTFVSIGGDNYLFLPKTGTYEIRIQGTGSGPATIQTSTISGDTVTNAAVYTDIPVTAQTEAQLDLTATAPQNSTVEVDVNGDGQIDSVITPDNYAPTIGQLFAEVKLRISELKFKNKTVEKVLKLVLTKKVEILEKRVAKVKTKRASRQVMLLSKQILWIGTRGKIVEGDVNKIVELLNQIERQI